MAKMNIDTLSPLNALATSSGMFDDLINIPFTHPLPSPGIIFKGLACLQTPKCRIDPIDQSSSSIVATSSKLPKPQLLQRLPRLCLPSII